jgi:hypothetical protein
MNTARFTRSLLTSAIVATGLFAFTAAGHAEPTAATGAASMLHVLDPSKGSAGNAGEGARPSIGGPLMEAERLIKDARFAEALAKVREAEQASADATPYERYVTLRFKAAAASGAGDSATTLAATEEALDTRYLAGKPRLDLIESLIHVAYTAKDYARVVRWAAAYAEAGGTQPDIGALRLQALYLSGDYAGAVDGFQRQIAADEAAGRAPTERQLQVLAAAQSKLKDDAGYARTAERLAKLYPTPTYWAVVIGQVDQHKLAQRQLLDLLRLMRATGVLSQADQYVAMANLALLAGLPAEAQSALDEGYAKGKLGQGPMAAEHAALRDKAAKQAADDLAQRAREEKAALAARDGNALVGLGQVLVAEGKLEAGIAMLEQGIARGGLRQPEEARLHLGIAQALAGRNDVAKQTLGATKGGPGMDELARLWTLYASSARTPAAAKQL